MTTQSNKANSPTLSSHDYVLRDEFLRFEQGITRWQEDTRAEQRTFQEDVRQSIRSLTHEIRETKEKPTNWGWVLTGVGTAATIAALIGGIAYTAISNRQDADQRRTDRLEDVVISMDRKQDAVAASRWTSDDQSKYEQAQKQELDRRFSKVAEDIDQLRDQFREHRDGGHPDSLLREIENVRNTAERADRRSEGNALKIAEGDETP